MYINFTLIVQALNFLIAYLLLRFLLLKPTVIALKQEKNEEGLVHSSIATHQADIVAREQEKLKDLLICQQYFAKHVPPVETKELFVFKNIGPELVFPQLDSTTVHTLAQELEQAIIEKVDHV